MVDIWIGATEETPKKTPLLEGLCVIGQGELHLGPYERLGG